MPCATPEPGVWHGCVATEGYSQSAAQKVRLQDVSLEGHKETDVESEDWFSDDVNTKLQK